MKAVILAGGLGTRLSEETNVRPKPMVEIGGRPLLWHIMKTYSFHGVNEFVICCGYKGYLIKEYFANYFLHVSDVTFDIAENRMEVHRERAEPWRVTLVDTGDETLTGGRLRRVAAYVAGDDAFCMTYGDGRCRPDRVPPVARTTGDGDRGQASRPLRCPGVGRRSGVRIYGKATRGRWFDKRWLLRAPSGLPGPDRWRRLSMGGCTATDARRE